MAARKDIVSSRTEKFDENGVRNRWKWDWMNGDCDHGRLGDVIRKLTANEDLKLAAKRMRPGSANSFHSAKAVPKSALLINMEPHSPSLPSSSVTPISLKTQCSANSNNAETRCSVDSAPSNKSNSRSRSTNSNTEKTLAKQTKQSLIARFFKSS